LITKLESDKFLTKISNAQVDAKKEVNQEINNFVTKNEVEVKEEFCIEIDFKEDLEQARKEIYKAPWKFAVN